MRDGALQLEAEGQIAYALSDQRYWQLNAVPIVVRWQQFPWNHKVATSAAFGLGLSYATELPELEVQLEGDSEQLLIYWVAELTAGPPAGRLGSVIAPASPFGGVWIVGRERRNERPRPGPALQVLSYLSVWAF